MAIDGIKPYSPVKRAVKTAAKVAVATAATAGTIAYLGAKGKLNPVEGGNKYIEFVKKTLKTPADFINKHVNDVRTAVLNEAKVNPKVSNILDRANQVVKKVRDVIAKPVESLRDLKEMKLNPDKFSETVQEAGEDIIQAFKD